jgi:signal transduction histidine kinase
MLSSQALTAAVPRVQNAASGARGGHVLAQTYQDLKQYLAFGASDEAWLVKALPALEGTIAEVVEHFYARALEHPEAAAVFSSEAQLVRQKNTLCDFIRRFFSEPRDEAYLARISRVGSVHVSIGLQQRYVVAGMGLLRAELGARVEASELVEAASIRRAIDKGLDLDLAVLVESYAAAERERAHEAERREGAQLSKRLESTGILAAGLAHEIRNPLNGAQLHLTFLRRRVEQLGAGKDVVEAVDVASTEIKRVATLLTELLSFAAPSTPQVALTDLREVCHGVATTVGEEAVRAGIQLDVTLPPAAVEAWLDAPRVAEVLVGVLHNAFEAISSLGGQTSGVVHLRAMRVGDGVAIEVEDNGPGIASAETPIFEPFFTTKPNGSGLGLSIAHRVLSDHGGALTFSSSPGRTIFRLKFPDQGKERAR